MSKKEEKKSEETPVSPIISPEKTETPVSSNVPETKAEEAVVTVSASELNDPLALWKSAVQNIRDEFE